ncbi:AsmA family protein [Pseudaminobacter arsenicus]|uniref:AsmA family protein n=1 Tax=Borborobacter arsenicus TaxID=1851146 RepID=A0A432VAC8_9HYPH|nr:AsmA family protein [Pseudaminobacter arsenicus]RUM99090.1 AsmA family protein [Pseudaminobacter arsenicus]
MPSPLIRRSIWAISAAALVVALIIAALPLLASTRIVRDRIAYEMSSWSGYRVTIGTAPEIEVWPSFRAILTNVTLAKWGQADTTSVISAERVEVKLSALAALRGEVVFSTASFVRPTLRVERAEDGSYALALPGGGRIARSVNATREAVSANAEAPATAHISSKPFGTVEVTDGRVTVLADGKDSEILTGITGKMSWPALQKAASVAGHGIWRGETVTLEASSTQPLRLFAGEEAPFTIAVTSAPVTASFDGVVKTNDNPYFNGKAKFTAPSLRRMLEWSRPEGTPGTTAIGAVSVAGQVAGDAKRIKFENAEVNLDGNPATGILDLALGENVPILSGTLAFETLDLKSFVPAFTPLTPGADEGPAKIDEAFSDRINLDLRLSAAQATAGTIKLAEVAATVQIKSGLSVFDISDAAAFGGNVQTSIRFDRKPEGTQVEMRLLAADIDGGAFGTAAGMTRFVPIGRGTISVILKGPGRAWNSILENAQGSISASFGEGALSDFDLASFLKRSAEGGFFALADVAKAPLPMQGLELKASISRGVVRLEKAEARTTQGKLWLSGIVPYVGRGLALSGGLLTPEQAAKLNGATPPVTFFVGGSWNAPFISPVTVQPPAVAPPAPEE